MEYLWPHIRDFQSSINTRNAESFRGINFFFVTFCAEKKSENLYSASLVCNRKMFSPRCKSRRLSACFALITSRSVSECEFQHRSRFRRRAKRMGKNSVRSLSKQRGKARFIKRFLTNSILNLHIILPIGESRISSNFSCDLIKILYVMLGNVFL